MVCLICFKSNFSNSLNMADSRLMALCKESSWGSFPALGIRIILVNFYFCGYVSRRIDVLKRMLTYLTAFSRKFLIIPIVHLLDFRNLIFCMTSFSETYLTGAGFDRFREWCIVVLQHLIDEILFFSITFPKL